MRQNVIGLFRYVSIVHFVVFVVYGLFLFLYGWVFGGAGAVHDNTGVVLWVITLVGFIVIIVFDGILAFSTIPRLLEEQMVFNSYSVEREGKLRDSGWYATTALAYRKYLRGGAGQSPPWAMYTQTRINTKIAHQREGRDDQWNSKTDERSEYLKFIKGVNKMKNNKFILNQAAENILY